MYCIECGKKTFVETGDYDIECGDFYKCLTCGCRVSMHIMEPTMHTCSSSVKKFKPVKSIAEAATEEILKKGLADGLLFHKLIISDKAYGDSFVKGDTVQFRRAS
jgi:hypothetical protein